MNRFDMLDRTTYKATLGGISPRSSKRLPAWLHKLCYETEALYEDHAIAAAPIFPSSNNGSQFTGTVDMTLFNRVQFLCFTGVVGGGGVASFQLQQTNNSNGMTNVNIAGAIGTNPNVAVSTSSQIARIEIRADQMTRRYVQCVAIVTVNASILGCIPMASEARLHPQGGSANDVCFPNIVTN